MLQFVVLCNLMWLMWVVSTPKHRQSSEENLSSDLITSLRDDANLDLSVDEEYEDLRAELLAYHTALASLTSNTRRSLKTTACWSLGGICVNYLLCTGHRFSARVPGCKNNLEVCCFNWNQYKLRDIRDKGIGILAMPWSHYPAFGGKGVVDIKKNISSSDIKKIRKKISDATAIKAFGNNSITPNDRRALILILRSTQ